uniref:Uncharacterized protein TCIL3000_6_3360 n=1 Tax=Trypanosoma congolense (strain IL3000) TaxID=1068625 RepID=G0UNX3_TRYCI|nr:unnamed protein product [Trypanosoma congolense IL3000]
MNTSMLLQRQMELHGMLRRPPHTASQLLETHESLKELSEFFKTVRHTAQLLRVQPQTVFQCLMQIGIGSVVSFDRQRRDGEVPMHQAKVLARANAMELEPRLRDLIPADKLAEMVELSKTIRTIVRIKVEDLNDFNITEGALHQAVEYLDFIKNASCGLPEAMFKFYMVEDEGSLIALLNGSVAEEGGEALRATRNIVTAQEEEGATTPELPDESHIEAEVRRLSLAGGSTSMAANDRLVALRTLGSWLMVMDDAFFKRNIRQLVSHLSGPLAVCAGEKRSAICRQACTLIAIIVSRAPTSFFSEGSLAVASGKWCTVLLRGVFVTVAAIAHASDMAVRALVIESGGHSFVVKSIVESLSGGTHPELRRRCLGYLALCVVVSKGAKWRKGGKGPSDSSGNANVDLGQLAEKYMDKGDAGCRRMARAVYVALKHFGGISGTIKDKKMDSLIQQEYLELRPTLEDVGQFEVALFGPQATERLFVKSTDSMEMRRDSESGNSKPRGSCGAASFHSEEPGVAAMLDIHDTTDVIIPGTVQLETSQSFIFDADEQPQNFAPIDCGAAQRTHSLLSLERPDVGAPCSAQPVKFSPSLRRKIDEFALRKSLQD